MAFHLVFAGGDPVRHEVAVSNGAGGLLRELEDQPPDVIAGTPGPECVRAMGNGDVAADGVALVSVHAALALLQVDRVAREVPVDEAVAPRMEVEPFLPDRRAGQHEGAERAIEGGSDDILADVAAVVGSSLPEAQRKHRADTYCVGSDGFPTLNLEELGVDASTLRVHDLDNLRAHFPAVSSALASSDHDSWSQSMCHCSSRTACKLPCWQ